jgi:para-nitrobenzyl esterase
VAGETATEASLAEAFGSTWRLVRIQSMDDTVTTPDERSKYTLTFDAGGQVAVVADCNRGAGTFEWSDDSRLEFGPLATTRAMCPPGSISDRFVRELGYVRSYVIRDGMLHLATMADGAILDFEPAPEE